MQIYYIYLQALPKIKDIFNLSVSYASGKILVAAGMNITFINIKMKPI